MIATTIIYGLLTVGAIFFLRNELFHGYSVSMGNLVSINQMNAIFIILILSLSFVIGMYASHYFREEIQHKAI